MPSATWNSLEILKLAVSVVTPIVVLLIGVSINRSLKRAERRLWLNQKLVEKRIELLDEVLPDLNDLFCYFLWIGPWKELSPRHIVERKRKLDRIFYSNRPYFPAATIREYEAFMAALFKTYAAPGVDAQLRTGMSSSDGDRASAFPGSWQQEWSALFVDEEERTSRTDVRQRHQSLEDRLSKDVGAAEGTEVSP